AQQAGDAKLLPRLRVLPQPRHPAETWGELERLFRILHRDVRAELVLEGDPHALEHFQQQDLLDEVLELHDHPRAPGTQRPNRSTRAPVTTTLTMASGIIQYQPSFMSWSYRYRGKVPRSQRYTKSTKKVFRRNQKYPGRTGLIRSRPKFSQPRAATLGN